MNEKILKEILNFKYNAKCSYLFINTNPSLIPAISSFVKNSSEPNLITLELSTDELEVYDISDNKDLSMQKILYESIISALLLKQIYSRFPDLQIPGLSLEKVNEVILSILTKQRLKQPLGFYYLNYASERIKSKNIDIALNIYISAYNNEVLQAVLNSFLNDRNTYKSRFFTPIDNLLTYYTTNGLLQQETHDYHERSLAEIHVFTKENNL